MALSILMSFFWMLLALGISVLNDCYKYTLLKGEKQIQHENG